MRQRKGKSPFISFGEIVRVFRGSVLWPEIGYKVRDKEIRRVEDLYSAKTIPETDRGEMRNMSILFENEAYTFTLKTLKEEGKTGAKITRLCAESGEETVLFAYLWPAQLTVGIEAGEVSLREDGVLCWQLHVTAHHVKGMAQGEYTETEWFEVENPFGTEQELVCRTVDIVRKTRFAIAQRHLKHLPHQTYPPVDGRQGPYGHP